MTNSSSSLPQKKPKNGAKKVGKKTEKKTGKKTGKKTTSKKKPTSSDSVFQLATPPPMASPYGYEAAYAHVAHQHHSVEKQGMESNLPHRDCNILRMTLMDCWGRSPKEQRSGSCSRVHGSFSISGGHHFGS